MNENLDKLIYESGLIAQGCWDKFDEYDRQALNKFAELIVQECARVARATPCPYEDEYTRNTFGHTWDMASIEAGREIVKHFGVE